MATLEKRLKCCKFAGGVTPTPTPVGPVLAGTLLIPVISAPEICSQTSRLGDNPQECLSGLDYSISSGYFFEEEWHFDRATVEVLGYEEGEGYVVSGATFSLYLRLKVDVSEAYAKMLGVGLSLSSLYFIPNGYLCTGDQADPAELETGLVVGKLTEEDGIESDYLVVD